MKLLFLVLISSLIIFIKNIFIVAALLLIILILILKTSKRQQLFPRIKPLLFISALIILFQLNHWQSALLAALKIMTLSLLVFYYTATISVSQIVKAFSFLPKTWQLMLTITLSLIPVIFSEAKKIKLIQTCRGYGGKNPFPIIIPLLHRTLNRAEQIALIITSRGY
jgi:energy-coupling factor transporter transmembrane protein EcfT